MHLLCACILAQKSQKSDNQARRLDKQSASKERRDDSCKNTIQFAPSLMSLDKQNSPPSIRSISFCVFSMWSIFDDICLVASFLFFPSFLLSSVPFHKLLRGEAIEKIRL
mmetsp:Transcript_13548/g.26882  ORF Transcript_13548/g.26882 Transcript_13548/m.26882 type:complete len:110 (-) Transcript_13548:157-486(-)